MSMPPPAYCLNCIHYVGLESQRDDVSDSFKFVCVAFPQGIPQGIISGEIDHSKPVEGDGGITFVAKRTTLSKHLPGEHDQSDHGNRDGRKRGNPSFAGASFAKTFDDPNVTVEAILSKFDRDTHDRLAEVERRANSVTPTFDRYYNPDKEEWDSERQKKHEEIIRDILSAEAIRKATPAPGEKPTFIILGGRGGSGKSSLKGRAYDPDKFIVIDPDNIKEKLPEYAGWNANEVHEESSQIADRIIRQAQDSGLNVVLDKTMKNVEGIFPIVLNFEKLGYRIEAHYMHLPRQKAAERAVRRYLDPKDGRFVPLRVILSNTTNEATFDKVRREAERWSFWDNDVPFGDPPRLIAESGGS